MNEEIFTSRKAWLRLFALSNDQDLEATVREAQIESRSKTITPPQTGIVTVRSRISGNGDQFNVGDACVTKAEILFDNQHKGYATVLGGQARKAHLVAMLDGAMVAGVEQPLQALVVKLAVTLQNRLQQRRKAAAATKVDFFTMIRGE